MSNYLGKQMLQYSGACYVYDPRGKDGAQFTSPWSKSKTSLLDGRHSVTHLSGMERENNTFYRQDSNSSAEGRSNLSLSPHAPVKQGFKLYTKSPGISSPTAATPVALRKPTTTSDTSSPLSENQTYLAIPKPVYAHNPCCDEVGCVRGRYGVEHGLPGMPSSVRKHNWLQTDPRYKDNSTIQKKAGDTVLQHGGLQFEPSAEQLQRIPVEYSAGRARAFPAVVDPNYSSYPCTLIRTHFGSLSEQSQQTSPRGYPCSYPSHYTYEHMTSDVYQEHSPMSKYGHLTQHPMFYYSQPDVEVENRTQCKDTDSKTREDVPVVLKHAIPLPQEHYASPHLLHSDIPYPFACTERFPNHALMQGLGYPYYAIPRFHLNANQCRASLKKQETSDRTNDSLSGTCIDYTKASATNIHQVKLNPRPHFDQTRTSPPDRASPSRRASESDVSRSKIQNKRYYSPQSLLNAARNQNHYSSEAQVSPRTQLPHLAHHRLDVSNTAVQSSPNVRKIIYSPPASPQSKPNVRHPLTSPALKVPLKRSISHTVSPVRVKEEQGSHEVELLSKKPKVEMDNARLNIRSDSPPMPVINSVFSLAPYQAHPQASGVSFPGRVAQRPVQPSERCEVQTQQDLNKKRIGQDKEQPVCTVTSTEKPVGDVAEPKNVKVEKDLSCVETAVCQKDCSVLGIDKDPEKAGSPDAGHVLEVKKCDSDKLESQPSFLDKRETSEEPVPVNMIVQINSSAEGAQCSVHEQVAAPQPGSTPPPQPSTPKLNFKNIPPHCLKLSTYKIVLPVVKPLSLAPPRENPSAQPTTENILNLDLQTPVRKHFFELHHSLYKLIDKYVFASSKQELRSWLSRLDPTEASAPHTKVKKVSCLLGVKARELWFNEGIKSALQDLLQRLKEYIAQDRCPFPHVMRTGAVFLPMLVVKELLFPMVQSNYIDQVLQEHKIELRPTTLSEEKILIQLHKRACSSRLRKLISLKHLPDIYADMVNVLYYCCVIKYLGE